MNSEQGKTQACQIDCSRSWTFKEKNQWIVLKLMVTVLVVLGFLGIAVGAVESGSPTQAVKQTIDEIMAVLNDEEMKKPEHKQERRKKLEEVVAKRFDYEEMGKRTLGKHWKKLNDAQQKEFVNLFQAFLTHSYANNVDGYSGEKIEYLKERLKGNYAEVQTKVISPKVKIPLHYRLLKKNDEWWVYDVVIDGVSLMKNYRSQFKRIMKTSSYEGLLDKLRSKVDRNANS
jgi:phospholipid transport system substrate-binding protein